MVEVMRMFPKSKVVTSGKKQERDIRTYNTSELDMTSALKTKWQKELESFQCTVSIATLNNLCGFSFTIPYYLVPQVFSHFSFISYHTTALVPELASLLKLYTLCPCSTSKSQQQIPKIAVIPKIIENSTPHFRSIPPLESSYNLNILYPRTKALLRFHDGCVLKGVYSVNFWLKSQQNNSAQLFVRKSLKALPPSAYHQKLHCRKG